ncbi:MAG TPA: hypothetical protein VNN20_14480 [Thermodesulfobacteriota bacterium]|nr:hypothetical protein [Thermodesulfobacteriota bacterium]
MTSDRNVNLPGLGEELRNSVEERVSEFEHEHEPDLLRGSSGWVPHIRKLDYAIAILINAVIALWLIIAFTLN